jgi:hypothetical protein
MGKIKRGILGGFSGKVANVIGGSWKGIAYMRSQPLSVANPKTAGQVTQRTAFSFCVLIAQLVLSGVIKPLWDRFAQGQSGYNAFMSANIQFMSDWATTQWSLVKMSLGKMASVPIATIVIDYPSNIINITWDVALPDGFSLATDLAYFVSINETQQNVAVSSGTFERQLGAAFVHTPSDMEDGDKIHVYLMFRRLDGSIVSDSSYKLELS